MCDFQHNSIHYFKGKLMDVFFFVFFFFFFFAFFNITIWLSFFIAEIMRIQGGNSVKSFLPPFL